MTDNITPEIYDRLILDQGLQYQVDSYYRPKEISNNRRVQIVVEALDPRPGEKILDVGCGAGGFVFHCAKAKALAFGIDYSKVSIEAAANICEKCGVSLNTRFLVGNAAYFPFKDSSFDKIVAADFIEHISEEEKEMLLKEIRRVLKPCGICVIFTPSAVREKIGEAYWTMRHFLFGDKVPFNRLHFGLINRFHFESLLKKNRFNFEFKYHDTTRPYFAKIPFFRHILALNFLWIVKKDGS